MQTKEIQGKIKSISNIKKITKTMEMVSVSKMRKAQEIVAQTQKYSDYALSLLRNIGDDKYLSHHYLKYGDSNTLLLMIVSSNKGLCGSFNSHIAKKVKEFREKHINKNVKAITVGRYADRIAKTYNIEIIASFNEFDEKMERESLDKLLKILSDEYKTKKYYDFTVIATRFISTSSSRVREINLLPLSAERLAKIMGQVETEKTKIQSTYLFEPSVDAIVEVAIKQLVHSILLSFLFDSFASEHSSRMLAMKNASDNAEELEEDLRLSFNKARQASITQEISEIAAGADAVSA